MYEGRYETKKKTCDELPPSRHVLEMVRIYLANLSYLETRLSL